MKRVVTAVSAIILTFVVSFTGFFLVKNSCDKLTDHLESICEIARSDNVESAIQKTDDAVKLWEESHGLIESFIRHEETDRLEEVIKSLPIYARQGNMERLEQQADLAIDEIAHLIRNEKPLISNIF